MVRSFAANGEALAFPSRRKPVSGETAMQENARDRWLDRSIPLLVVAFLAMAALSVLVQFTVLRNDALKASENNLAVAARLAATIIANSREPLRALDALPVEATAPGRRFMLVDRLGMVVASQQSMRAGEPVATLFSQADAATALAADGTVRRLALHTEELASVVALPAGAPGMTLFAIHPIEDELVEWRSVVQAIGALLACFAAIVLAFVLAYYAQRALTRHAGQASSDMRTQVEIALEYGNCGIWDWMFDSDEIGWSDSMHRLLGRHEAGAKHVNRIAERLHPDDADLIAECRTAARCGKRGIDRLFRMRTDDGNWLWLRLRAMVIDDAAGRAQRIFGIAMDVTAERLAEAESTRADARLRDAIESISEAFVLWDENNRLVLCNSKYQSFHGLDRLRVERGMRYRDLMEAAVEPKVVVEIERGDAGAGSARMYEAQFQDARWLLISERPTHDGGFVSIGTDITARKQQEERLFDNERQLRLTISDLAASRETLRRQASQLAELADRYLEQKAEAISANRAKAEFLANMNHEIRTPLNHIIGFAEMIEHEVLGPVGAARYRDYAQDIRLSGMNLLCLISDILEMARIEAGRVGLERSPQAVGALLGAVADEVRPAADAKQITLDIEPELASDGGRRLINVDPNAVRQALAHLLRNAIRLSPMNGRVSLHARLNGRHVNVFISDIGSTLTAHEIGAMGAHFGHIDGMLENGCKGSGLGVAIARSLIELHGGTLKMRSSPGYGSIVMARLPIEQEPVQLSLPMRDLAA